MSTEILSPSDVVQAGDIFISRKGVRCRVEKGAMVTEKTVATINALWGFSGRRPMRFERTKGTK